MLVRIRRRLIVIVGVMVGSVDRLYPLRVNLELVKSRRPIMLPLRQFRRRLAVLQNANPIGQLP
jgi:hypothetical protein